MVWTNAAAADLNDAFFKSGAPSFQPPFFLGLSTSAPARDGTNITEPIGNAYARIEVEATDFDVSTVANPAVTLNANEILFPEATGVWGIITHAVLFTALTSGTALRIFALSQTVNVVSGIRPRFPAGDLIARL